MISKLRQKGYSSTKDGKIACEKPNSLREEAAFLNIHASNGSLKCHRVVISTALSFGDKVISWYTSFTF